MEFLGFEFDVIYILGAVVAVLIVAAAIGIVVGVMLLVWFWKTRKVVLPRLTVMLMNIFDVPIHAILRIVGLKRDSTYLMREEIINKLYQQDYTKIPAKKRIIFLPQCLRSPKCPAPVDKEGIHCRKCGMCGISDFIKKAEKLGIKVFIAPGGSMVKRIYKKYRPQAVFGVACHPELKLASDLVVWLDIPAQGIALTKDGCVDTEVDWEQVEKQAFLGLGKKK